MSLNIYDAANSKLDKVQVKNNTPPVPITITENGTYTAPTGVFGYSPVTVNVSTAYMNNNIGFANPARYYNSDDTEARTYITYPSNTEMTLECYARVELPSNATYGRILQIGTKNNIGTSISWNKADSPTSGAFIETAVGGTWWHGGEDADKIYITDYLNALHHYAYIIGTEKTQLYIDGVLVVDSIPLTTANINSDVAQVYFLHNNVASRRSNGYIYSFRQYNRALSVSEIQHNMAVDQLLYGT